MDSKGGASFLSLNGTDASGAMNGDSAVLGIDVTKQKANQLGYQKTQMVVVITQREDALQQIVVGCLHQGSNLTLEVIILHHQPEVIECHRRLKDTIDVITGNQVSIGSATAKTTYYPDGDTFSGGYHHQLVISLHTFTSTRQ